MLHDVRCKPAQLKFKMLPAGPSALPFLIIADPRIGEERESSSSYEDCSKKATDEIRLCKSSTIASVEFVRLRTQNLVCEPKGRDPAQSMPWSAYSQTLIWSLGERVCLIFESLI